MSYGFDKAKPSPAPERKLDFASVDLPAPSVSSTQEAAAVAKGDALGFGPREPVASPVAVVRKRKRATPNKSVMIKGPAPVMDRFIAYANEQNATSYWEALDTLLKSVGRGQ